MNYMERILLAQLSGGLPPKSVSFITIAHDDNCQALKGGGCNCDCDISFPTEDGVAYIQADGSLIHK